MITLRLNISNLCNFSCKYCHVFKITDNKMPKQLMSYETMELAITEFIKLMNNRNETSMNIQIYGGETLLNRKSLFKVIEKFGNLDSGVGINWIVYTNGSLMTPEDALFFEKYDVDIHISCDGYAPVHNLKRVDKFGKGTFDKVERALKLIKEHGLRAQLNSYGTLENIDHLRDLVDIAKEYGISRVHIDLLYSKDMLDPEKYAEKYYDAYKYGVENGIRVFGPWTRVVMNMSHKSHRRPAVPTIGVEVDGRFFFFSYPVMRDRNLYIGNLNSIMESNESSEFFKSVYNYYLNKCRGCELCDHCFGHAIKNFQFHMIAKEGYGKSCDYMRRMVSLITTGK